jgi:hypothetical protein
MSRSLGSNPSDATDTTYAPNGTAMSTASP